MKLIDVDELIKAIEQGEGFSWDSHGKDDLCVRKKYIDNAPTVEITEEQAIDKLHETGWLIRHDKEMTERPHGKWKKCEDNRFGTIWYRCPFCDEEPYYANDISTLHFCPNCGADMRTGGAE